MARCATRGTREPTGCWKTSCTACCAARRSSSCMRMRLACKSSTLVDAGVHARTLTPHQHDLVPHIDVTRSSAETSPESVFDSIH
jgi:phosphoribosyl 1,2-cyclic phosphodiesterase